MLEALSEYLAVFDHDRRSAIQLLENQRERGLTNEKPMSMAINVTMTRATLVNKKSSPSNAC